MDNYDSSFDDLDTSLLRSPNSYPSPDLNDLYDDNTEDHVHIPTNVSEASHKSHRESGVNPKDVMELLKSAAEVQGVSVTSVMSNTALALSNRYGIEASSMEWFIAGVTFANSQMIIEKMAQSIKDMQIEIRNLQGAAGTIKTNTEEFMSKMRANKNEITSEMTKTKDTIITAMQELRTTAPSPHMHIKVAPVGAVKQSDAGIPPAQEINKVLLSESLRTPVATKTPEQMMLRKQEDFLLSLGFELEEVGKIPPDCLSVVIDPDYLEIDLDLMPDSDIAEMTDIIISSLIELGVTL
ncbi:TPA_asm: P [Hedera alphacytorhabdovirus 1]|nr:TPA_asm: P [Hedera alphacytorhabdovirus 1]